MILPVMNGLLCTLRVHPEAMRQALDPALLATDLADYLVKHGVPFREAHGLVGQVARQAQVLGVPLDLVPLHELQMISPVFSSDVSEVFDFQASVNRRAVPGGTAESAVRVQIAECEKLI
jgi:argininosuccinate lyase